MKHPGSRIPVLLLSLFLAVAAWPFSNTAAEKEEAAAEPTRSITRTLHLQEGENWVRLHPDPAADTLRQVLKRERFPAGLNALLSTRLSWHAADGTGAATNVVWLDAAGGWQFMKGGDANDYRIPPDQGFIITLPEGAEPVDIEVREVIPEAQLAGHDFVHTLAPSGAYTMVRLTLPEPLALTNSGLREAGFRGAPSGEKVNPNNSDELRVLQGGGRTLASPRARILMDGAGHFVYWSGGPFLRPAEDFELQSGETVVIHTTRTTSNLYWRLPFAP